MINCCGVILAGSAFFCPLLINSSMASLAMIVRGAGAGGGGAGAGAGFGADLDEKPRGAPADAGLGADAGEPCPLPFFHCFNF
mmetsp:Transcript_65151/g.146424  ORF Transcript_65151/g.146424 Transcript_65151/m.146424 type:complete len:83 (+) Transcript_65151:357-605(+)